MDINAAIRKLNALKEATKACKGKIELIGLDDSSVMFKMSVDDNSKKSFRHKRVIGFCPTKS